MPELGQRIEQLMAQRGLEASELAARSGISTSYLSRILSGEVTNPTIEFVLRIARGLDITVSALLGQDAAPPPASATRTGGSPGSAEHDATLRAILAHMEAIHQLIDQLLQADEPRDQ